MTTARHAVLGVVCALGAAASLYCVVLYAWLTAYYTRADLIRQAKIRANGSLTVFVIFLIALLIDAVVWWRSRRKVG